MVDEIRAVRARTDKPFGVDLLTALPDRLLTDVDTLIREGASVFVAGLGVPRDVIALCHDRGVLVREHVRQGAPRDRRGRGRLRPRGRAGHRGRRSHRHGGDDAARPAGGRRGRRTRAGGRRGRHRRRPRARGRARARRRRRVGGHAVHRHARGALGARLQGRVAAHGRGRHRRHAARTAASRCARSATRGREYHDEHPEEVHRFPEQLGVAVQAGALHLGADDTATGVDPDRECYPAGQGVGAIDALVPAGELVVQFVTEAERALRAAAPGADRSR